MKVDAFFGNAATAPMLKQGSVVLSRRTAAVISVRFPHCFDIVGNVSGLHQTGGQ